MHLNIMYLKGSTDVRKTKPKNVFFLGGGAGGEWWGEAVDHEVDFLKTFQCDLDDIQSHIIECCTENDMQ